MPVLTGVGATVQIRQAGLKHPIIALTGNVVLVDSAWTLLSCFDGPITGNSRPEDRQEASDAGMDDFVTKPVTRQAHCHMPCFSVAVAAERTLCACSNIGCQASFRRPM